MLFNNDDHHSGKLRKVRDIVEIVAIVAAGFWAAWIFVYQDRIVPAQAAPEVNFATTLEKVSEKNGLIGVRLTLKMHNTGTVRDWFLGYAVGVVGERVTPALKQNTLNLENDSAKLAADYNASKPIPLFAKGFLTQQADPKANSGLFLEPEGETSNEDVFYVRAGAYDRLRSYVIARFTRDTRPFPTSFTKTKDGLPGFLPRPAQDGVIQVAAYNASLDLNGH